MDQSVKMAPTPLRIARVIRGLTQSEVASLVGVDRSTYCHYERGTRVPRLDTALKLAAFFGQDAAALFGLPDAAAESARKALEVIGS